MSFEGALEREQKRQAALLHQEEMDAKKKDQASSDKAESERQRLETVKNTPEWLEMVELSQDTDFLLALEMYWNKYVDKRSEGRQSFTESLSIIERLDTPHSLMSFSLFLRDDSDVGRQEYTVLITNIKPTGIEVKTYILPVNMQESIDFSADFDGTLEEFYEHLAKHLV